MLGAEEAKVRFIVRTAEGARVDMIDLEKVAGAAAVAGYWVGIGALALVALPDPIPHVRCAMRLQR